MPEKYYKSIYSALCIHLWGLRDCTRSGGSCSKSLSLGVGVGRDEQRREGEEHEDDAAGERDAAYRDARCDQAAAEHRAASAQEVAGQAAHQHTPHALRIETRAAHAYKAWIKRTRVLLEADVQLLRTFGRVFPLLLRVMHCVGERVELGT